MSSLGDEAVSLIDGPIAQMSSWLDDKEDEYRSEINSLQDECSTLQEDLYHLEKEKDNLEQEVINLNVVIQNMKDGYDENGEKI